MSTRRWMLGAAAVLVAACAVDKPAPTGFDIRAPLYVSDGNDGGNGEINLGTHLTGDEEPFTPATPGAPTPADSRAQGQALFRVNDDGTVDFRLIASNINNVVQAHIHCAPAGVNGPIRMWLFPTIGGSGPALTPPGLQEQNGVLASGTFNPTGVTCPASPAMASMPLLQAIRTGFAYVNVHTNDGQDGPNTGPGDFPGGEIRGQIGHGR